METQMSVAEIMNYIASHHLTEVNFEELVPQMLRAICKDEHVDAVGEFIRQFEDIEWSRWSNG